ncbi:MAG: helicase C-terminal domain-containing protein [Planctomycetaceae bacterium]
MTTTSQAILGDNGPLSRRWERYEVRNEQLDMAAAVEKAIADKKHLLVEAGTGVGKSFAYLVPAILAATARQHDESLPKIKVVISTHTINLQEQLLRKDIPFLNSLLPVEFTTVLVKGRRNYLSRRRLSGALERSMSLFSATDAQEQLQAIARWTKETSEGSLSDLALRPLPAVWDEVASETGNCLGKKCPTFESCFYFRARRRMWNADILIVNHALFFSDLAIRREGASLLPDYDIAIFDEAHTLEAVAADHLGLSITNGQIEFLLTKLFNDRTQKGLLVHFPLPAGQQAVTRLQYLARETFARLREWQDEEGQKNGRIKVPVPWPNGLTPALNELAGLISQAAHRIQKEEQKIELTSAAERCQILGNTIDEWWHQRRDDSVYWMEVSGRRQQRIQLKCSPIEVGPILRQELFQKVPTVIMTSATLAIGGDNFNFTKQRLGLTACNELKLGSPFDYQHQAKIILPEGMPDPGDEPAAYESAVVERIEKYVGQSQGRAFVLFTNYKMMTNCAARLMPFLAEENIALLCQGDNLSPADMLKQFVKEPRAVLFGVDSFWQGVDVPGDALQNVIIAKLPFSVPDHPLLEARLEAIRRRNGNPFYEYQIPEAVIKLKQGFGRLIRSQTDTGQVVILDPRVRTKPYGRVFMASLPECPVVVE